MDGGSSYTPRSNAQQSLFFASCDDSMSVWPLTKDTKAAAERRLYMSLVIWPALKYGVRHMALCAAPCLRAVAQTQFVSKNKLGKTCQHSWHCQESQSNTHAMFTRNHLRPSHVNSAMPYVKPPAPVLSSLALTSVQQLSASCGHPVCCKECRMAAGHKEFHRPRLLGVCLPLSAMRQAAGVRPAQTGVCCWGAGRLAARLGMADASGDDSQSSTSSLPAQQARMARVWSLLKHMGWPVPPTLMAPST